MLTRNRPQIDLTFNVFLLRASEKKQKLCLFHVFMRFHSECQVKTDQKIKQKLTNSKRWITEDLLQSRTGISNYQELIWESRKLVKVKSCERITCLLPVLLIIIMKNRWLCQWPWTDFSALNQFETFALIFKKVVLATMSSQNVVNPCNSMVLAIRTSENTPQRSR